MVVVVVVVAASMSLLSDDFSPSPWNAGPITTAWSHPCSLQWLATALTSAAFADTALPPPALPLASMLTAYLRAAPFSSAASLAVAIPPGLPLSPVGLTSNPRLRNASHTHLSNSLGVCACSSALAACGGLGSPDSQASDRRCLSLAMTTSSIVPGSSPSWCIRASAATSPMTSSSRGRLCFLSVNS